MRPRPGYRLGVLCRVSRLDRTPSFATLIYSYKILNYIYLKEFSKLLEHLAWRAGVKVLTVFDRFAADSVLTTGVPLLLGLLMRIS